MMFRVAVDLGYGYVKAMNEYREEVIFRSLVCPSLSANARSMAGILGARQDNMDNLHVRIRRENEKEFEGFYVGELAEREGEMASFTLDEKKFTHPYTQVLLFTALALLTRENDTSVYLATGLPFKHFEHQKRDFRKTFIGTMANVKFITGPQPGIQRTIRIEQILVYPQALAGAFAFLHSDEAVKYSELTRDGELVAFVDVGYKTTDYVVLQIGESFELRQDLSGTLDVGMNAVYRNVSAVFTEKTGGSLPTRRAIDKIIRYGKIHWDGKEYDFNDVLHGTTRMVARMVLDELRVAWTGARDIQRIFLMGGGGLVLHEAFCELNPNVTVVNRAQMANAEGYLIVSEQPDETSTAVS